LVREIAYGYVEEALCTGDDLASRIQAAITTYKDRFCMGVRDIDQNNPKSYADSYSWQTFETIGKRITNFSHGLRRLIKPRDFLGICAANRPEWLVTDLACILQNIITVPIYCLFNDLETAFIVKNTPISIIVCDKEMLPRFIRLHSECPSLQHIVCMDTILETMPSKMKILKQ
jgi:long-chain acyl-CoA synthetase